jgi:ubiquinone/menaquinone biosynthesis C-methylase UbiE
VTQTAPSAEPTTVKACCAALYASDWSRLLLGESLHPGGLALTDRLADLVGLDAERRVLDVACGRGVSAIHLVQRFGCHTTGIDLSGANVTAAAEVAERVGATSRTEFRLADAEALPFAAGAFDVVLCECALCTFPDKELAVHEFARVLHPGGRLGLSDVLRSGPLAPELETLAGWLSCVAGALSAPEYAACLETAGFEPPQIELHNEALSRLVRDVRLKLLSAEVLVKLGKLSLPASDVESAKKLARAAQQAVAAGLLGYGLFTTERLG